MPKNFQKLKQTITKMAITTTIIGVTVIGANAETLGTVSGRVNFRKKPSTKSEVITKINKNSKVIILGEKGNWYNIKYNGDIGYASKKYIKETPYSVKSYSATLVAKQRVNVRKGPSTQYTSMGKLKTGEKVKVTGKVSNGWYEVTYNNKKGYITGSSKYVREYNMEFTVKEFSCTAVAKQSVNVREQPSTQYPSMGKLKAGDKIKVTGKVSNGWYEVIYNGEIGYITGLRQYVSIPNDAPVIETKNDVYEIIQNKNKKSEAELKQIIEATATDKEDGTITDKITFTDLDKVDTTTPKDYTVTLTVKDEDGKATTKTITIKVKKAVNLEIKKDKITLNQNKSYPSTYFKDEKVATATDGEGKDITDKIEYSGSIIHKDGKIDSSKTGTFDVKVSVKGSNDVEETKTIKVEVLAGPTITANDINIEQGTLKSQIPSLINATATDRNGQSITPTYEGIDDINTSNVGGTYTVTVKAVDSEGGTTTKYVTVKIVSTPTPPTPVNHAPKIEFDLPSNIIKLNLSSIIELEESTTSEKSYESEFSKEFLKMTVTDEEDETIPDSQITFDVTDVTDNEKPIENQSIGDIRGGNFIIKVTAKDSQGETSEAYVLVKVTVDVN